VGIEQLGVRLTQGPQSWSIIQQKNGAAFIELAGIWSMNEGETVTSAQVYARVVKENSGETINRWMMATMEDGQSWKIRLEQVPAGGLYRIETCLQLNGNEAMEWAVRGDMIHHVGVGDLWVIAGQSNAAGYGKGPVNDAPELGIHLFRNNGRWDLATHPFNESTDTLHIENRETSNPGHSPFLAFSRMIKRETGWPIGLVQTALGGSHLKAWNPEEEGTLYRNMLSIVQAAGGSVRGVLWYQGCSDCNPDECHTYAERFRVMVNHWRRDLGDSDLPFMTVQLNRHTAPGATFEDNRSWGVVREQQRSAARLIPHITLIPAIDCPLSDDIHNSPAGNLLIGERMARAALATVYGQEVHYRAPEISKTRMVTDEDGRPLVQLEFDHVGGYLVSIGPNQPVFALEDEEGFVDVLQWSISGTHTIDITPGRPFRGQAYIHGGSERNPAAFFPLDSLSYMPLLSFYRVPVQH
jgi:sialate O-acetylesterase